MEEAATENNAHTPSSALKSIFKVPWFLIRHPVLTLLTAGFIALSAFSFLAHFNPAIAQHFGKAATYFGAAALVAELPDLKKQVKGLQATIARKDAEIRGKSKLLAENNKRMSRFRERGARFKATTKTRFKKIAISDTAGELLGWIPIVGDIASLGLAAGGIYEMCQMFKEIEAATEELGATYQVYTGTFCEQTVDKNTTLVAEKAANVKGEITAMTTVVMDYTSTTSKSALDALVAKVQSWLDQAYTIFRNLYDSLQ